MNNLDPRAADKVATALREMYADGGKPSILDLLHVTAPVGAAGGSQKNLS